MLNDKTASESTEFNNLLAKASTGLMVITLVLLPVGRSVEIPTVLMALLALFIGFRGGFRDIFRNSGMRHFTVFFAFIWIPMVLSLLTSEQWSDGALFCVKYLRFYLSGCFILYFCHDSDNKLRILSVITFLLSLWMIDSLVQWMFGTELLGREYDGTRITGPFKHLIMPVHLSILLPLALTYIRTNWSGYLFWIAIATIMWVLFLAGSRSSWIVLLFAGVLFCIRMILFRLHKNMIFSIIGMALLSLILGLFGYQNEENFRARLDKTTMIFTGDYQAIDTASSHRLPIWETAIKMSQDHPFLGVGINGFKKYYPHYANEDDPFQEEGASHPHLFLFEILVETGITGCIMFLMGIISLSKLMLKQIKSGTNLQAAAAITIIVAFFPLNSHVSLYGSVYSQIAWFMTAFSLAIIFSPKRI